MTDQGSPIDSLTIALQPIHDSEYRHVADRLLYRHRAASNAPREEEAIADTARALAATIYELDDGNRLGSRELFIELPRDWLRRSELLPTPASLVIICLEETFKLDTGLIDILDTLDDIRERGYRLAASVSLLGTEAHELLPMLDILWLSSPGQLSSDMAQQLKLSGKRLMAMDIRDQAELEAYQRLGCHYFNGRYLAEPTFHASRPRSRHGSRAAQLRLVNELYRDDVDTRRLYELTLQMPHLHVAILRRANSIHYSRGIHQTDLRQAMQVIGLHELRRLVMTLLLAGDQPSSKLMVRMALIRAFMCHNLAQPFRNIDPEDAFTTGLFSMMGALLEEDLQTLLEEVPLPKNVATALTERKGHLGAILTLAEEHERTLSKTAGDTPDDQLQRCYLEALDQTDALMNHA